jgi:hypothetical protein
MTLSATAYFRVWGVAFLLWVPLSYKYYEKWQKQLDELGDKIRSYNARSGYDQSVGRKELARSFIHPYKEKYLKKFAERNKISTTEYVLELEENINKNKFYYLRMGINTIGLVVAFGGITYLLPWGILSAKIYLLIIYFLLAISLCLYLYSLKIE